MVPAGRSSDSLLGRTANQALPIRINVLLGVVPLASALPPGGVGRVELAVPMETVGRGPEITIRVSVDDDGTGAGRTRECDEENNTSASFDLECSGLL